jgi:WD40 repeat protein
VKGGRVSFHEHRPQLRVGVALAVLGLLLACSLPTPQPKGAMRGPALRAKNNDPHGGELRYEDVRHALVVGINDYSKGSFSDLAGPRFDAAEVAEVLRSRFGFEDVVLLVDAEPSLPEEEPASERPSAVITAPPADSARATATKARAAVERARLAGVKGVEKGRALVPLTRSLLLEQLEALKSRVKPGDALFFFYAGHGMPRGLVPADADLDEPDSLLSYREVVRALRAADAHHTLVVLDSCYSGAVLKPGRNGRDAVSSLEPRSLHAGTGDNLGRVFNRRAFQVITAGAGDEQVEDALATAESGDEQGEDGRASSEHLAKLSQGYAASQKSVAGHSPFTAVLLQGLRGLTGRADGKLFAKDLGYYLQVAMAEDALKIKQAPSYGLLGGGEGDFLLIPTDKVLNPHLVSPLYMRTGKGQEDGYVELRTAACGAIVRFVLEQDEKDRPGLTRSTIPHLLFCMKYDAAEPSQAATAALVALVAEGGAVSQDFQVVVPAATALLAYDSSSSPKQKELCAELLGSLPVEVRAAKSAYSALDSYLSRRLTRWKEQVKFAGLVLASLPSDSEIRRRIKSVESGRDLVNAYGGSPAQQPSVLDLEKSRQDLEWLFGEGLEQVRAQLGRRAQAKVLLNSAQTAGERLEVQSEYLLRAKALDLAKLSERDRPLLCQAWDRAPRLLWASSRRDTSPVLAFDPNATRLATATRSRSRSKEWEVLVWDRAKGEATLRLPHSARIDSLAWSSDGRQLATGTSEGAIKVWDPVSGSERLSFQNGKSQRHRRNVKSLVFSPSGDRLLSSGRNERVWNLASGKNSSLVTQRGYSYGPFEAAHWGKDGRILLGGRSLTPSFLYCDAEAGVDPYHWGLRPGGLSADRWRCVDISPQGLVACGYKDGTLKLYSSASDPRAPEPVVWKGHERRVSLVLFTSDGKRLVSFSGSTVRLWNLQGKALGTIKEKRSVVGASVAKGWLATTDKSGGLRIERLDGRRRPQEVQGPRYGEEVSQVSWSADGRRLAALAGTDVHVWNPKGGTWLRVLESSGVRFKAMALLQDSRRVRACTKTGAVHTWSLAGDSPPKVVQLDLGSDNSLQELSFSPHGAMLCARQGEELRVWNAATGGLLHGPLLRDSRSGDSDRHDRFAWLEGALLTGGWNGQHRVRRLALEGKRLTVQWSEKQRNRVVALDVSRDGKLLAVASKKGVGIWSVTSSTRTLVSTLVHSGPIPGSDRLSFAGGSVAFSPDGSRVATAHRSGTLRLWRSDTGVLESFFRVPAPGEGSGVTALTWSPGGNALAVGGRRLTVWDVRLTLRSPKTFRHPGSVVGLSFLKGDRLVTTNAGDGALRVSGARGSGPLNALGAGYFCAPFAISPDQRLVATNNGGELRLYAGQGAGRSTQWRGTTPDALRHSLWSQPGKALVDLAWSSDGECLVGTSLDEVRLWDSKSGTLLWKRAFKKGKRREEGFWLARAAWNPRGDRLAIAYKPQSRGMEVDVVPAAKNVVSHMTQKVVPLGGRLWTWRDGSPGSSRRERPLAVAWSPSGHLAVSSTKSVRVLMPDDDRGSSSQKPLWSQPNRDSSLWFCLAFSRDGAWLAQGNTDGVVRILDSSTGDLLRELPGHSDAVTQAVWARGSDLLATASNDKTARVWDLSSLRTTLTAKSAALLRVAEADTGHSIVNGRPVPGPLQRLSSSPLPRFAWVELVNETSVPIEVVVAEYDATKVEIESHGWHRIQPSKRVSIRVRAQRPAGKNACWVYGRAADGFVWSETSGKTGFDFWINDKQDFKVFNAGKIPGAYRFVKGIEVKTQPWRSVVYSFSGYVPR